MANHPSKDRGIVHVQAPFRYHFFQVAMYTGNTTIQEEFCSAAFRGKLYRTLDELQADLDLWLQEYNQREHSGTYCYGKMSLQTFLDSNHLAYEKLLDELTASTPPT